MTDNNLNHEAPLSTPKAASYCGLAPSTLEKMRVTGGGPVYLQLSARKVGYDIRDLDAWKATRRRSSTSDRGGAQ